MKNAIGLFELKKKSTAMFDEQAELRLKCSVNIVLVRSMKKIQGNF